MHILCLLLSLNFTDAKTPPKYFGVKYNSMNYFVRQENGKFVYKDGNIDRAILIKPCNKDDFKQFWRQFNGKFRKKEVLPESSVDYVRLNYDHQLFKIKPGSELGNYLKSFRSVMDNFILTEKTKCGD
jgi:hypothetical protein